MPSDRGDRAVGTQAGRSGTPPLRGRRRAPRTGRGLERGSGGRKRGLRAPWAAGGEWERGPPRPTDAGARGHERPPRLGSLLPPSPASTRPREARESPPSSRWCGRSGSGLPHTPLLSPRRSPDARGLAARVLESAQGGWRRGRRGSWRELG